MKPPTRSEAIGTDFYPSAKKEKDNPGPMAISRIVSLCRQWLEKAGGGGGGEKVRGAPEAARLNSC